MKTCAFHQNNWGSGLCSVARGVWGFVRLEVGEGISGWGTVDNFLSLVLLLQFQIGTICIGTSSWALGVSRQTFARLRYFYPLSTKRKSGWLHGQCCMGNTAWALLHGQRCSKHGWDESASLLISPKKAEHLWERNLQWSREFPPVEWSSQYFLCYSQFQNSSRKLVSSSLPKILR